MRKLIVIAALLATTSTAALAADLPLRTAPPAPYVPPVPVFTWTGGYFGINGGYAFDSDTRFGAFNPAGIRTVMHNYDDGFTAGGQIGYNFQLGSGFLGGLGGLGGGGLGAGGIVVGIEADAAYTDLGHNNAFELRGVPPAAGLGGTFVTTHAGLDYLGTVRGRIGYAFNTFMIYGTGGFAYGSVDDTLTAYTAPGGAVVGNAHRGDMATGYTYGGGVEYALPTNTFLNFFKSSAVTIKGEYLHYDLGARTVAVDGTASTFTRIRTDGDLARAGINYKF